MKIGVLIRDLSIGGGERICLNLVNELVERNHEVTLFVVDDHGKFLEDLDDRVKVVELKSFGLGFVGILPDLFFKTIDSGFDVFHTVLPTANLPVLFLRRLQLFHIPTVLSYHAPPSQKLEKVGGIRELLVQFSHKILHRDEVVVTPASETSQDVSSHLYLNTETINNPVVRESMEEVPEWEDRDIDLLFAGRLDPQKKVENLLKATEDMDRKVVICGNGKNLKHLQKISSNNVEFTGFVDNIDEYMKRSRIFVLPSNFEALNTSSIEAMSNGCNVVTTDCTGMKTVVGEKGTIVEKDNLNQLQSAIESTLEDPESPETMVEQARKFSVTNGVDRYVELFEKVRQEN